MACYNLSLLHLDCANKQKFQYKIKKRATRLAFYDVGGVDGTLTQIIKTLRKHRIHWHGNTLRVVKTCGKLLILPILKSLS